LQHDGAGTHEQNTNGTRWTQLPLRQPKESHGIQQRRRRQLANDQQHKEEGRSNGLDEPAASIATGSKSNGSRHGTVGDK